MKQISKDVLAFFKEKAAEYGFEEATVEFVAFGDLKVNWTHNNKFIQLGLSDYLEDAPKGVQKELCEVALKMIRGERVEYSRKTVAYLTSERFREAMVGRYIARHAKASVAEQELLDSVLDELGEDKPKDVAYFITDVPASEDDRPYMGSTLFMAVGLDRNLNRKAMRAAIITGAQYVRSANALFGMPGKDEENDRLFNDALREYARMLREE